MSYQSDIQNLIGRYTPSSSEAWGRIWLPVARRMDLGLVASEKHFNEHNPPAIGSEIKFEGETYRVKQLTLTNDADIQRLAAHSSGKLIALHCYVKDEHNRRHAVLHYAIQSDLKGFKLFDIGDQSCMPEMPGAYACFTRDLNVQLLVWTTDPMPTSGGWDWEWRRPGISNDRIPAENVLLFHPNRILVPKSIALKRGYDDLLNHRTKAKHLEQLNAEMAELDRQRQELQARIHAAKQSS
ncbi:hypothetical protein [Delftia phage PhiW-14]|uniref:Uncharacterized protein n=1 Tax=Delftia phage PhiW-14 TaxID=665032 RepID=C9DGD8_BPW14|nr:hypothetical protein DP-phiW-14_gp168 [Delftia phage PhiW-14]ACV50189.1 hypothetical protein [Delftia phage PhiW-14]